MDILSRSRKHFVRNGNFRGGDRVAYEADGLRCTGIITAIEKATAYIRRDRGGKTDAKQLSDIRKA